MTKEEVLKLESEDNRMRNDHDSKKSTYLLLHISLLFSSLSGVCSKMASGYTDRIFSLQFIFWFGLVFVIMFGYAVIWQQILKRMPLTCLLYTSKHGNRKISDAKRNSRIH